MADKEFLDFLREILNRPHTLAELRKKAPETYQKGISRHLKAVVNSGDIVKIRGGRYGLPDKMNLVKGRVQGHPDGFGFVLPEEAGELDIYIGPKNFRKAMHGDKVVARVESVGHGGKREGSVIRILERARKTIAGIYQSSGKGGVVLPSQTRIIQTFQIPSGNTIKAKSGQVVLAKIVEYPENYLPPTAEIIEILGFPGDLQVETKVILREHDLPEKFPEKVEKAASKASEPVKGDFKERLDLREQWVITIDGETAKDFDDAVSIEEKAGGLFELGVHIADVSHYVKHGTPLDAEGYRRGTSTYFPGSVVPMLPFYLSDNICSLRPHVERLTLSCVMRFDANGKMTGYRFAPSVIKSAHRMTYSEVAKILDNPNSESDREKADKLTAMKKLYSLLKKNRDRDGSIDFDLPEPLIILNIQGEPEKIIRAERNDAHRLIEDFMLAANRAAADFLKEAPSLYRVHPEPDLSKLKDFFDFAARLGHFTENENLHMKLQEILEQAVGKPDEKLLNYMLLRSMKQATYSSNNVGHFGLAFSHYTHFTSPIRRYPDLIVHRLIKATLNSEREMFDAQELETAGSHCSIAERNSEDAERAVVNMLKVRFAADREGEEFEGIITGVKPFGIFVELNELLVEGLMRVTDLHDDYYDFIENRYALVGKRTNKIYKFGDIIKVRIKYVDLLKKQIELEPLDAPRPRRGGGHRPVKLSKFKKGKGRRKKRGR